MLDVICTPGAVPAKAVEMLVNGRLSAGNGKVFVRVKEGEKPFKPWPTAAQ